MDEEAWIDGRGFEVDRGKEIMEQFVPAPWALF
jgi:hypothetical protein